LEVREMDKRWTVDEIERRIMVDEPIDHKTAQEWVVFLLKTVKDLERELKKAGLVRFGV
jgi:hypothetical protein